MQAALQEGTISNSDALSVAHGQKKLQEAIKAPVDSLLPTPLEIIAFSEEEGLRSDIGDSLPAVTMEILLNILLSNLPRLQTSP